MTLKTAQKLAQSPAQEAAQLDRIHDVRVALREPALLRHEAERLLAAIPTDCDLLTWSAEGHAVALVASVLAHEIGRDVKVHQASLVAPLALQVRDEPWTWISAEQLLGFGSPRAWAIEWAERRDGTPLRQSGVLSAVG